VRLRGRPVVGGHAVGEALVSPEPVSFYGGVDPESGVVVEPGHPCEGLRVSGKVFVFPQGKGSTVGSYVLYRMGKLGTAPLAILNRETEAIIATGCVMAGIPLVDRLDPDPLESIRSGWRVEVQGSQGLVLVQPRSSDASR